MLLVLQVIFLDTCSPELSKAFSLRWFKVLSIASQSNPLHFIRTVNTDIPQVSDTAALRARIASTSPVHWVRQQLTGRNRSEDLRI